MSLSRLRWTRNGVAALVALDLLALLGTAFHRTTVTTTRSVAAAAAAPVPVPPPASQGPVDVPPPAVPAAPPATQPVALPVVTAAPVALPRTTDTPSPTASAAPVPSYPTTSAPPPSPCPVPLQSPSSNGGLQSLIGYAPAFGSFTSEAFAGASAYAPVLTLVGPVLAQYPTAAPVVEPVVLPLLAQWEQVLKAGYGVVGPYYSPYRASFLAAETALATTLAPYSQQLASSAAASCLIDLQYTLIASAPKP